MSGGLTTPGDGPLVVDEVTKRFDDVTALDGLSLALAPGELLAIVGPSGCGKSTLLRVIAGLTPPDSGRIVLGGKLVDDASVRIPPEGRGIGLVFQDHALFPHLTVRDNVAFGVRGSSTRRTGTRAEEMLELVSLDGYGDRYPHELSGGERQRVALARALAPSPSLLLFDEPFASIDHNLRTRLRADVVEALRATATPALFVTHDQPEALAIGDRVAVLRRGRVAQLDSPAAVFHRPVDRFVGAFMGEASFLPIEGSGSTSTTPLGPIDLERPAGPGAGDGNVVAMVRPDDLDFVADEVGDAAIEAAEYRGSGWLLTVRLASGSVIRVAASHLMTPEPGRRGRVALVTGHRQVLVSTGDEPPGGIGGSASTGRPPVP